MVVADDFQNASALDDLLGSKFDRVEVSEDPIPLLQMLGGNERLHGHFFFGFFTCTFCFCIIFCRFGNFVVGFLGPCRSFLLMVVVLSDSILPAKVLVR